MTMQKIAPNDTACKPTGDEVLAAIGTLARAFGFVGAPQSADRFVHEKDSDLEERTGATARAFADACRGHAVDGAVRTPSKGWRATETAIAAWLANRRKARRTPERPQLRVVEDDRASDRALLAQAGRPSRAR